MKPELNKQTREFICRRAQVGTGGQGEWLTQQPPAPHTRLSVLVEQEARGAEGRGQTSLGTGACPSAICTALWIPSPRPPLVCFPCKCSYLMPSGYTPWGSEEKDTIVRLGEDNILCWGSLLSKGFSLKFSTITERIGQEAYKNEQFPNQSYVGLN